MKNERWKMIVKGTINVKAPEVVEKKNQKDWQFYRSDYFTLCLLCFCNKWSGSQTLYFTLPYSWFISKQNEDIFFYSEQSSKIN